MIMHKNIINTDQKHKPRYNPIAIPTAIQNNINPQILRILQIL